MERFFESIIRPALVILQPRVIVEIGIGEGKNTQRLLEYCQDSGALLHSIDPLPQCDIDALQATHEGRFIFHRDLSLHALPHIDAYDVLLIDGDHNWYTVYYELRAIEVHAREQGHFPLVFLHDIGWPYGRRDLYYAPDTIPLAYRQWYQKGGMVIGNGPLVGDDGLNSHLCNAMHEHGAHSGVLTAIEDFIQQSSETLHFQQIPGFCGLGILSSAALLSQKLALRSFLESLRIHAPIVEHIHTLERAHLEYATLDQQKDAAEKKLRQREYELTIFRRNQDRPRTELTTRIQEHQRALQSKNEEICHMMQTRSWRWTAPLRRGESFLRQLSPSPAYAAIALLWWLWRAFGSPLPATARHIRHDVLARFFPLRSPRSPLPSTPPLSSFSPSTSPPHPPPHDFRIAAIVVCHNHAPLLQHTLKNLCTQTEKASEILILDDDSTDETRQVALRYTGKGVEYLHGTWRNTYAAWNAGLRSTESPLLTFLRAGVFLPPIYLSCCLKAFRENREVAIASPETSSPSLPFDPVYFAQHNTLSDYSLVRRDALLDVGGWSHGLEHDAVWITWRRILANGWKAITIPCSIANSPHTGTRCHSEKNFSHHDTRLDATLCLSLSGREWMWPRTKEFLEQQTYPHAHTHLVIIDTSQDIAFGGSIQSWLSRCDYGKHTYLPLSVGLRGLADLPRRVVHHEVAIACSLIYESFAPLCTTAWVFFLEDDVLPPIDVYPRLLRHCTDRTVSVSALCMQRSGPHPIVWEWDQKNLPRELPHQIGVTAVGGNGFCCVALRGEYVRNGKFCCGPGNLCHDHNFYRDIVCTQGLQALLDWSCICQHYVSPVEWKERPVTGACA